MSHSLNEIEAQSKRAARGAGLPWGLAEEAAKATRWLCAFGFPGAAVLADVLEFHDRVPTAKVSPMSLNEDIWGAGDNPMSPLIAGACLSDCAERLKQHGTITMENLSHPLFAVPFGAATALRLSVPVCAEWQGARVVTDGQHICVQAPPEALTAGRVDTLQFTASSTMTDHRAPSPRAKVSDQDWARLGIYAHRTLAPATEESRQKGAGAGLGDND